MHDALQVRISPILRHRLFPSHDAMMYAMENKIFDVFIVYYRHKNLYKVNDQNFEMRCLY